VGGFGDRGVGRGGGGFDRGGDQGSGGGDRWGEPRGNTLADARSAEPIEFLMSVKRILIRERFLNYDELRRKFEERYPVLPSDVAFRDTLRTIERMVSSVNMLVTAALSTHMLLTLADLEQFILTTSRDFEDFESFDDLKLGPLHTHPKWQRVCPNNTADSSLSGEEVVKYLAVHLANSSGEPFSPTDALDALAVERGFDSHKQLGVFLRGESWITFVVNRARLAAVRARHRLTQACNKAMIADDSSDADEDSNNSSDADEDADNSSDADEDASSNEGEGVKKIVKDTHVQLTNDYKDHSDASEDPLKPGEVGVVIDVTVLVRAANGKKWWYDKEAVEISVDGVNDEGAPVALSTQSGYTQDAETRPANVDAVLRALQNLLVDLAYVESPGERLAAVEEQLLAGFHVDLFDKLSLPETTLAAFCRTHRADVDHLLFVAGSAVSSGLSASAAKFASAMLTRLPGVLHSVLEYVMCNHFGVDSMSVSDLQLGLKQHLAVAPDVSSSLPCALVIAANSSSLKSPQAYSREDALALFDALPPLTDVAVGMPLECQTVHRARLGSLVSFLLREKLPIIEVSHGSYVKLEVGTISHFEDALRRQQATRAVALATHLCIKAGGVELAPIELMRACMTEAAKDLTGGASARLVVQCAAALRVV
jgi:hypothetical protein